MHASDKDPLALIGTELDGKYAVEAFVAEGGFSLLYRAQHKIWKQPVALKFLKVLSTAEPAARKGLLDGFVQEGALLRELSSRTASILQAHDVGTWTAPSGEWYPFLVLEWLAGKPLDAILEEDRLEQRPPFSLDRAMHLLEPAAKALDVVHKRGVAHRDIKPANLFVIGDPRSDDAFVKVLDFGIAKVVGDMAELTAAKAQTGMGLSSFTPWYGAPEQFSKKYGATGPWTDVFALALVVIEMITGRPALDGAELPELALASTSKDDRPTPRSKGLQVSDAVESVFQRALAVDTTARFATSGEFWNALREAVGSGKMTMSPQSLRDFGGPPSRVSVEAATMLQGTIEAPASQAGGKSKAPLLIGVAAVLAAGAAGAYFLTRGGADPKTTAPPPPSAPAMATSAAPSASAATPAGCPESMVKIPGGSFYMGHDDKAALPMEKPQHEVKVDTFCIAKDETTVAEYRSCSDQGQCPRAPTDVEWPKITPQERKTYGPLCNIDDPGRDRHPINCVTWEMASNYCEKQGGRLPTSAEWEYAVRGPDGRIYPWGDEKPSANHLNACGKECVKWGREHGVALSAMYDEDDGYANTAPVGSFPKGKSRYGLDDVIGNVMEWVWDWDAPYTKDAQTNPKGPASGKERVIRGGAWNAENLVWTRPSFRYSADPTTRSHGIGFRCARSLPTP